MCLSVCLCVHALGVQQLQTSPVLLGTQPRSIAMTPLRLSPPANGPSRFFPEDLPLLTTTTPPTGPTCTADFSRTLLGGAGGVCAIVCSFFRSCGLCAPLACPVALLCMSLLVGRPVPPPHLFIVIVVVVALGLAVVS